MAFRSAKNIDPEFLVQAVVNNVEKPKKSYGWIGGRWFSVRVLWKEVVLDCVLINIEKSATTSELVTQYAVVVKRRYFRTRICLYA